MRRRLRLRAFAAGALLLAASSLPLPAQKAPAATPNQDSAARGQALLDQNSGGPDLIQGPNGEPVLRYPVAHQHAATGCLGWLYITHDTMRFEVLTPEQDKDHAFEKRRSDLTTAKQWRFWGRLFPEAEFKFSSGGTYHFFHVRKNILQTGNTKFGFGDVLPFQDLIDGAERFDDIAAVLKARQAPPPAPPAPPPTISMLEPTGAEEGKTVSAYDSTLHVRGIASQASGISSISVNGQTAFFKPLAPQTVEFDLRDVPLGVGMSAVVIVATGNDKTVGQMTFKVSRPEVRVLEPAAGAEVEDSAVRVRGLAVGFQDVDRVEIAGQAATLRRRDDGSVDFEASAVPLTVGANNLQGSVVASSGRRQSFSLALTRKPPPGPPPLTVEEVETALRNELPKTRIASLAGEYGVDFEVTDDVDKRLRAVGADSGLLLDLVKAYKGPSRRKAAASPPPPTQPSAQPAVQTVSASAPPPPPAIQIVSASSPPPQSAAQLLSTSQTAQPAPQPVSAPPPAASQPAPAASPPVAQPPPTAPPKPAGPPELEVLDPAGVAEGKSVETSADVLRGTASHPSGIRAVLVNDKPATLKSATAQSAQFEAAGLALSDKWTPVTVVARAADNSETRLSFKLSHPTVQWLNPPNGVLETPAPAILAQAIAAGFNGVEKVELGGNSLSLEKLSDGRVEFHIILPLSMGQNTFHGVVVGTSGFRVAFKLEVKRVPGTPGGGGQTPDSIKP